MRFLRRLLRWAWNASALLSLLLCVATAALWVRSYWAADVLGWARAGRFAEVFSSSGGFYHSVTYAGSRDYPVTYQRKVPRGLYIVPGVTRRRDWHLAGFRWLVTDRTALPNYLAQPGWSVGIPCWFASPCFAFLPAWWLRVRRRRRRFPPGSCPSCGYDLRSTPDASARLARCPECGAVPPAPAPSS